MISFERVSVTYPEQSAPALVDVDLEIPEGELAVVVGPTGSGKSTLLGAINGLVPHFTGGTLAGRVTVAGRDTRVTKPRDLADVVGVVGQDPLAGFVAETVEEELAFTTEQLGVEPAVMRKRVEETIDLLGLQPLRGRPLRTLSGGEQQRVAIGAVLTAQPSVLVLDEPTSALDPTAAEEVLAVLARLVHDLGLTAVVAEHRLERILQFADLVVQVGADRRVTAAEPAEAAETMAIAPPVVHLGRLAGWSPLPVSVRDARRAAADLRSGLVVPPRAPVASVGEPVLRANGVSVAHGPVTAVRQVDLDLPAGRVTALMGRNGAGKSSLLWALQGSGSRAGGTVAVHDAGGSAHDPADLDPGEARALVALVPQTPGDLLFHASVGAECAQSDRDADLDPGRTAALLEAIAPGIPADRHPRDLSEGQRLSLALAVQLVAEPRVVLLDEPTRGLDYAAKDRLAAQLRRLADSGRSVLVATHDVEFVAAACDHVVVMAGGEVIADGATADVVVGSAAYAPQVARILRPLPVLTVAEAAAAMEAAP